MADRRFTAHFDGACRPPRGGGVATYGFVLDGPGLHHEGRGLATPPWSPESTNNVAEYTGAVRALEWMVAHGISGPVVLLGDSQLVLRQMQGVYRVRAAHLRALHERLATLCGRFSAVELRWVPRERNREADRLSKQALEEAWADAVRRLPDRAGGGAPPPGNGPPRSTPRGTGSDYCQRTV